MKECFDLYGAIIGDICGSSYEGRTERCKVYDDIRLVRTNNRFTDDTVCTIGVAEAILLYGNPTPEQFGKCIQKWCQLYPRAGYGAMFREWIDDPVPYGSYGNGSAMRVSPVGLIARSETECLEMAKNSALCSHDNPEGIKGAQAIALAIYYERTLRDVYDVLERFYPEYADKTLDEIRPTYKFDSTCQGSVPIALLCYIEGQSYEEMIKLAISMGGDSDTIAAMVGGIAMGCNYDIPEVLIDQAEDLLPNNIKTIINQFQKLRD